MCPVLPDFPQQNTNGYQQQAYASQVNAPGPNGVEDEPGGGLLSLICGSLCKDTPLATLFGPPPDERSGVPTGGGGGGNTYPGGGGGGYVQAQQPLPIISGEMF